MHHPTRLIHPTHPARRAVVLSTAAALLALPVLHGTASAGPVSNIVVDLVVTAETEGIELTSNPPIEADFQRDTGFLDGPGTSDISVSSLVLLQDVSAEAKSTAEFTYETAGDTATFLYSLTGFVFGSIGEVGDDFGASGSYAASIETEFTLDEAADYLFTSTLGGVVGGGDLFIELIDEETGDIVDLSDSGTLDAGTYAGLFELTGSDDTGAFTGAFTDGKFSASLELNPSDDSDGDMGSSDDDGDGGDAGAGDGGSGNGDGGDVGVGDGSGNGSSGPEVIPTPSALLGGLVGVALLACRRRRD